MSRKLVRRGLPFLLIGLGLLVLSEQTARSAFLPRRPLGTLGVNDPFNSVFQINANNSWVGLPNADGGQSFIAVSLLPTINYYFGTWQFDPRVGIVTFFGPDGAPLATFRGLDPMFPGPQSGRITAWPIGPVTRWSYLP